MPNRDEQRVNNVRQELIVELGLKEAPPAHPKATQLEILLWEKLLSARVTLEIKKEIDHYDNCRTENCAICRRQDGEDGESI
jgi:hypothetical protein